MVANVMDSCNFWMRYLRSTQMLSAKEIENKCMICLAKVNEMNLCVLGQFCSLSNCK